MTKKNYILFTILFSFFVSSNLNANVQLKIIESFNNLETLKFNFEQMSYNNKERGVCFLKRPHFLKCIYTDDKQKELIINRKNLVIYHKKFNKVYYYPVSNSYFADVLDKKKFKNLINKGQVIFKTGKFQIKYFDNSKGEIILLFDENFDLEGWVVKDLSGNYTEFKINSIEENLNLDKKIFFIPETN